MTKKTCNDNYDCDHVDGKIAATDCGFKNMKCTDEKETLDYGFYSNVLKKPFERLEDLKKAEYIYYEEQKLKEDKAAQKKTDAQKVENAFKALNTARKEYKEKLSQLTKEYSEELENLKKAFELGKKDITSKLTAADEAYSKVLKEFTTKYPEGYHLTMKDGDYETTISRQTSGDIAKTTGLAELVDALFNWL